VRIILKRIIKNVHWIILADFRASDGSVVKAAMNVRVS